MTMLRGHLLFLLFLVLFFSDPKFVLADVLISGSLVSDSIWSPSNGVYIIDSSFSIPSGVTLTIEPGTIIKARVTGQGGPSIYGTLRALGTSEFPIYFTSINDDSLGGDSGNDGLTIGESGGWQGLYFKEGSIGEFDYTTVRYSGYGGFGYGNFIGIENAGGDIYIRRSNFYDNYANRFDWVIGSYRMGTAVYNKNGTLSISDSIIDNSSMGVFIESGTTTISNSIIKNSEGYTAGYGVFAIGSDPLTLLNNTFINNRRTAYIDASKSFIHSGNISEDRIRRGFEISGLVKDGAVLHSSDLPVLIYGQIIVGEGDTLNIAPGTVIKMDSYPNYGSIYLLGNLIVNGDEDNKIYITSIKDDSIGGDTNGDGDSTYPAPRDWNSIVLENGSRADLNHTVILYGGFNYNGEYLPGVAATIYDRGSQFSITNSSLEHNFGTAIFKDAGVMNIFSSDITNNVLGIWSRGGFINISHSNIYNNGQGIYNQSGPMIDARNNWWGSVDGPEDLSVSVSTGSGDKISGEILYTPFLTSPDGSVIIEECCSSVLFLPGFKGSVLKKINILGNNDTLWPPTFWSNDMAQLALDDNGESLYDIRTDGIVDTFYGTPIYAPFSQFMNGLVSEDVINEWSPFPYDWRFSPIKILEEGVKAISGNKDLVKEVERLAKESKTGKVTIISHSMGGLVGKVLIKKLEGEGKANLIDSFVMVGTPQLGTPQAIASLLHGDEEGIAAGFIVNPSVSRSIGQNMSSAYNLLPSSRYFIETSNNSVITFDPKASFTKTWREFWGDDGINSYSEFLSFVTGSGVLRSKPSFDVLRIPEILKPNFMTLAENFHSIYDNYVFPNNIRVVQIAGWGRPTTKAVNYKNQHFLASYETVPTREGDKTVVYPSAISSITNETYFFNILDLYRDPNNKFAQHRDMLNPDPVQDLLKSIVKKEDIKETNLITSIKPQVVNLGDQLIVSTHSPVILGAYDQFGNFTGIDPNQDLSQEILIIKEEIPGSSFVYSAESQNIFLPKNGIYNFVYKGIDIGPTTVEIKDFIADTVLPIAIYSNIPTNEDTIATFVINSIIPKNTFIEVDLDGDGQVDYVIISDDFNKSFAQLIAILKAKIQSLNIKDSLKKVLIKRIDSLEKKIEKKKEKNLKILNKLIQKINKTEASGKIEDSDAEEIISIIKQIESTL